MSNKLRDQKKSPIDKEDNLTANVKQELTLISYF